MSGDLEFHILEMPKFRKSLNELKSGLDTWLYFLRFGEKIDAAALPAPLKQPTIVRAVEVLRMLNQTDIERERYEARRKAQLDHDSAVNYARREGETAGRMTGEIIGAIHTCELLLGRPQTPGEQLRLLSIGQLKQLAQELVQQAISRQ